MHGNRRRWGGFLVLLALAALGGTGSKPVAATKDDSVKAAEETPRVVSPPDRAVLLSGNFDVIYRGEKASLEVDSRPVPWEKLFGGPIHVGRIHLDPGMHRVKIGDRMVQLCVALNEIEHDGPSDWRIHRVHTMSPEKDRCAECHDAETEGDRMIVGKVLSPYMCTACHTDRDVKLTHQELIQPLKSCDTCHLLHGSPYPSLLKAPQAEIQKQYAAVK